MEALRVTRKLHCKLEKWCYAVAKCLAALVCGRTQKTENVPNELVDLAKGSFRLHVQSISWLLLVMCDGVTRERCVKKGTIQFSSRM